MRATSLQMLPESTNTLQVQMKALANGKRKAVMLTDGEHVPIHDGFKTIDTNDGTLVFDPKRQAEVSKAVASKRFNHILGYGPYSKEDIAKRGEPPFTIVENT